MPFSIPPSCDTTIQIRRNSLVDMTVVCCPLKHWEFRVSKLCGACSLVFPSFRKSSYPDETHIFLGSSGCVGGTDQPLKLETSKTLLVPDDHRISRKGWAKIFIYPNSKLPSVPPIPSSFIPYSILFILQAQFT